eukprot:TRINITY_DN103124_c0_g1_i1.p1 TRINITY_DN103124_c0_g1~~TRINITY_DN103124_c0_g1_i1.p1  ORF type:complete len:434 (-),score=113.12 TRINITY_DN103124_c0_g1_i1:315-1616(-)
MTLGLAGVIACGVAVVQPACSVLVTIEEGSSLDQGDDAFHNYMDAYGRAYTLGSEEYHERLGLFKQRVARITAHNAKPDALWRAGINHLTDRTESELASLTGWRGINRNGAGSGVSLIETEGFLDMRSWDKSIDYRHLGMAKDVPEQSACGSCWAVATTAMLQAHSELHVGNARTFSTQQLVNCVPNPKECGGQGGCKGATVELGMKYITKMGLLEDKDIPYEASDQKCEQPMEHDGHGSLMDASPRNMFTHGNRGGAALGLHGWQTLAENKVTPLVNALMQGPVAISVGAEGDWHSYSHGVFDGCSKDSVINHAVLLFGMGQDDNNKKYWLVRNSWGPSWGEDGYIRLLRQNTPEEEEGHCGTDHDPAKGIACKPYPDQVRVCGMCGILYDSVSVKMGSANAAPADNRAAESDDSDDSGKMRKKLKNIKSQF